MQGGAEPGSLKGGPRARQAPSDIAEAPAGASTSLLPARDEAPWVIPQTP